jgi:hypothetical protein
MDHARQDHGDYAYQDHADYARQSRNGYAPPSRNGYAPQDRNGYAPQDRSDHARQDRTDHARQSRSLLAGWPAALILAVQAAVSGRLIGANTAHVDEATYLLAGHAEIAHLLHGAPVESYQTFFSGAPVFYPVLGAMADGAGGLTAARLLSLAFMLAATWFLYAATQRLFGRKAAIGAAAAFAAAAPTQFMGAFATYDALALCLLAASAWCAVRGADASVPWPWLAGSGAVLAAANAAAYSSALLDPVVVALATCAAVPMLRKRAWLAGVTTAGAAAAVIAGLLLWGGHAYVTGIRFTVLNRAPGNVPAKVILQLAAENVGLVAVLAVAGTVVLMARGRAPRSRVACAAIMTAAVFLAPVEQARIHTLTSAFKHAGYGAWFAAAVAGYALAAAWEAAGGLAWIGRPLAAALTAAALFAGWAQASTQFRIWPNETRLIAALRPYIHQGHQRYLVDNYDVIAYYLGGQASLYQWTGTWTMTWKDPVTKQVLRGLPAFRAAISGRAFAVVAVSFNSVRNPASTVSVISYGLRHDRTYRLSEVIPYQAAGGSAHFWVWLPTPVPPHHGPHPPVTHRPGSHPTVSKRP